MKFNDCRKCRRPTIAKSRYCRDCQRVRINKGARQSINNYRRK